MMTKQMKVLTDLEQGRITSGEAVLLLKQAGNPQHQSREHFGKGRRSPKNIFRRRGHWLGIHVREEDHNIRLYVPIFLLNAGFFIGKKVIHSKYGKDMAGGGMKTAREVLGSIKQRDMRDLVRAIRESGNTDLVTVTDEDTVVRIRIV